MGVGGPVVETRRRPPAIRKGDAHSEAASSSVTAACSAPCGPSLPRCFPPRRLPWPSLYGHDDLWPFPTEPLGVQILDEPRQPLLPRLLPMVIDLAKLLRVQPEFARHLHMCVREPVPPTRLDPTPGRLLLAYFPFSENA